LNFLYRFFKNAQISNFVKIRAVGAELFNVTDRRTDGRTVVMKLKVDFRNFEKAPKHKKM